MSDIKEELIDILTGYSLDTYEDIQYVADELISKGVVPVVRCKDCQMWGKGDKFYDLFPCMRFNSLTHPDDFCSYGERKEGADNG